MPRKKKTDEEKVTPKKDDEDLDSLFKNFGKEEVNMKEHEEESELEEDVEDSNLNLQPLEFHQFMQLQETAETGAPVLERIAGSAPRPIFIGGISRETGISSENNGSKEELYGSRVSEDTEPKYSSEPGTEYVPERVDFTRVGRTDSFREEINQERFFRESEPRIESQNQERFERVERFDIEKAGRRNSFERPEEKYEKYRPKSQRT